MQKRYDIAIIGTGPAGLSAALTAKIRNKSFILFGNEGLSSKLEKAHQINNYLGFPGFTGKQMQQVFKEHLQEMEIEITAQKVTLIYPMGDYYSLLADNNFYESTTIILATGVQAGQKIDGEEAFLGRGVSYCATCDGGLYKGKTVAVIATHKEEEAEANFLATLAQKVYYIPLYKDTAEVDAHIEVVKDYPVSIEGDQRVSRLILKNQIVETEGIFILRETISPDTLISGLALEGPHVKVDRLMQTNLPGCFAAGDLVGKPYQYIKAAGEGNIAVLSACQYVDRHKAIQN